MIYDHDTFRLVVKREPMGGLTIVELESASFDRMGWI